MRRLSQLLVLALSSSSILLYQFLQPAIGAEARLWKHLAIHGFRQSCFERDPLRFGFNELKRLEVPTGPRK
jgi:hypothetical protein